MFIQTHTHTKFDLILLPFSCRTIYSTATDLICAHFASQPCMHLLFVRIAYVYFTHQHSSLSIMHQMNLLWLRSQWFYAMFLSHFSALVLSSGSSIHSFCIRSTLMQCTAPRIFVRSAKSQRKLLFNARIYNEQVCWDCTSASSIERNVIMHTVCNVQVQMYVCLHYNRKCSFPFRLHTTFPHIFHKCMRNVAKNSD